ncbi:MAG: alkaline phosphatase [Halioglobus sp.]
MFAYLASALLGATALIGFNANAQQATNAAEILEQRPRHVILIIGDGMDDQQITIARNYLKGATGRLLLDQLPVRSTAQVLTVKDEVDGTPVYVADSANTATSMATGVVTSRGRIATTAGSDEDITTIVELAEAAGYRSGLVTTASVTDATPSAFATHISFRLCENPELMEEVVYKDIHLGECNADSKANGGPGSIAEQLASSTLDVILGGGRKHFTPLAEGSEKTVLEIATDNGFQHLSNAAELEAASMGTPLLGLFSKSTLPVRLRGENKRAAEEVETSLLHSVHDYLGEATLPEPMHCEPNPKFASVPSLKQMTDTALAHLSHDNATGFFLMIESASIDKQSHERKPCGSIGELEQLEEALQSALVFAESNPDTLILVTADHGQAAQIIPFESLFSAYPIPVYPPGKIARLFTPEGSHMTVNYATSNFFMEEHTGANVPLFSNAVGQGIVPAFIQQTELFTISKNYLGL